jgi:phosphatidylserine/phosphatidylglycerophosphate/cardiolipin synthase-like enzyme
VSNDQTPEERDVIRKLEDTHLSYPEAAVATLMFSRRHARPANELINIIDVYIKLDDKLDIQQAIDKLKRMNWLTTFTSFGLEITKAAPDLQQKIADYIQDPASIQRLVQSRPPSAPALPANIQVVGPMTDERNYGTFLDLLRNARDEICLPMLTTSPYEATVTILRERARHGVRIRILLASPEVAKDIRGETSANDAKNAIKGWKDVIRGYPR